MGESLVNSAVPRSSRFLSSRFLALLAAWLLVSGAANVGWADDWTTIYGAAREEARHVSSASLATPMTPSEWHSTVAKRREMWREMIGLSPLPPRTPLKATITGVLDRGDYVVEKLHFQSVPGAYVVGNVYRPAKISGPLPAVLYLCGHTKGKVNQPYQANPRWFGQHGYVALVLDPIQLGESQGLHHGTYREGRWDWQSRGYTPAGTEVWNAMRALDYLETREDVDSARMGVTGLSGGGVISWCLGAADERVKVVVPVCQSGSIEHVVFDRATDGHCDCAFWINYYRWCWPDIGALIAPRALLIASGTEDVLWRPYGYRDVAHRLRRQYAELGASDRFDLVEDLAPHGYTPTLRKAIFTWFNKHLKDDPSPVTDDITDFVEPEENLLVFGGQLPANDQMRRIDELLVEKAPVPEITGRAEWEAYQEKTLQRLQTVTFRNTLPDRVPRQRDFRSDGTDWRGAASTVVFQSVDGMTVGIKAKRPTHATAPVPTLVYSVPPDARQTFSGGGPSRPRVSRDIATAAVEVRNTAVTSVGPGYLWTARRTYPLLGQTLPERQVSDMLAAVSLLKRRSETGSLAVFGSDYTAALAIYAALLDPDITEIVLQSPPETHEDPDTPEFLGVLRVGDLPQNLALAFPRTITFVGDIPKAYGWTQELYRKCGAGDHIRQISSISDWRPE